MSLSRSATTWSMDSRESLLNTIMESRRFKSSGGKYSEVRSCTSRWASSVTLPSVEVDVGCARMSLPRLLVKHMIVFFVRQSRF